MVWQHELAICFAVVLSSILIDTVGHSFAQGLIGPCCIFVCFTRYRVAPWGFLFAPSPINERVAKF